MWTSLVSVYCTLSVASYSAYLLDHNGMDALYFSSIPTLSLDAAEGPWLQNRCFGVYSGWKSVDNYDTCASVFVVLFNGFMSLTSYFDVMYRY